MKQLASIVFIAIVFFSVHACNENRKAKNYNNTSIDGEAQNLISKGVEAANAEIQLSQLAAKSSKNQAIIGYANRMITEHTATVNDLKQVAKAQSASVADTLNKVHKLMIASLLKKSGAEFDKNYIQAMVQDHEQTIALYKTVTGNPNRKITDLADKILPKLKEHLKQANDICTELK